MACACASASASRALHVRFGPIATELMRRNEMPLCAISGLTRRSKKAPLFGHLVGIRGTGVTEYSAGIVRINPV
jgi:hypothetical protein